jgi:hypothetical protein
MSLSTQYRDARAVMPGLCAELEPEDTVVQSMPDVSPSKWHLAHVTWFFERFILKTRDRSADCCRGRRWRRSWSSDLT